MLITIKIKIKYIISLFIKILLDIFNIDFISLGKGIGYNTGYNKTGEEFFIKDILKRITKDTSLIFFDVGANIGNYSLMLIEQFPTATLYCFEPNPYSFTELQKNLSGNSKHLFQKALGDNRITRDLYISSREPQNELPSMNSKVFTEIHKTNKYEKIEVEVDTIDHVMSEYNIPLIDFLKVDVEGFEITVLRGAKETLKKGNISIIQFEFNEMNVVTKTFMKDFFDILPQYSLFRLNRKCLVPMETYTPAFEIFQYQNIIAIKRDLLQLNNEII